MEEVRNYLDKLLEMNKTIVLACSGGPDSMALLFLLCELKDKYHNKIVVCHVNHQKREESKEEAEFVKKYAEERGCIWEYLILPHQEQENFHNFAHKERYKFFKEMVDKYHSKILLTAHHATDLAETVLMRLLRGATLKGYSGFQKEVRKEDYRIIRPLISYTKDEILKFVEDNNIPYRTDYTNMEDHYMRNRIRHHILPLLEKENTNFYEHIRSFSKKVYDANEFIDRYITKRYEKIVDKGVINGELWKKEDDYVKGLIIEKYLREIYDDEEYLSDKITKSIKEMIENTKPNLEIKLPLNKILVKEYDKIYLYKDIDNIYEEELKDNLEINKHIFKYVNESNNHTNYCIGLDSREIKMPLYVRTRRDGDKMEVKNLKGHRKIKDILIDSKVPKSLRKTIPIVVDSNNTIIWIPGLKKSQLCKDNYEKCDIIIEYI